MDLSNFTEAIFARVSFGHPNVKVYTGEIIGIAVNPRAGYDVTVRHDHGGERTLHSVHPDFFRLAD